jgi:zinc transport system ATP-binding protein
MDEPVSGLDPVATQDFYDMTDSLRASAGMAIIMVSHDMGRAISCASHVLHLKGRQEFFGTRDEYLKSGVWDKFAGGLPDALHF